MTHPLLQEAVRENAAWCALVSAAHGLASDDDGRVWWTSGPPPPFYPDAITLVPGVGVDQVLQRVGGRRPCGVKDSFADLDAGAAGLDVLFEATWIGTAGTSPEVADLTASPTSAEGPDLGPDVVVLDVVRYGSHVGRGTGHRHGRVIGLSGVGASDAADLGGVFAALVAGVRERLGALPVVGYERGAELESAVAQGFSPLGPLRVLTRPAG